jgi:hypothetical protein
MLYLRPAVKIFLIHTLLLIGLISGCVQTFPVTYDSVPQGAMFYADGMQLGYTPYIVHYAIPRDAKETDTINTKGAYVRWPDGVTKISGPLSFRLNDLNATYTFVRSDASPPPRMR